MHQHAQLYSARYERLGGSIGDAITSNGSANTKGSWLTALTTGFTYEYLIAELIEPTTACDWCVDIGINDGGGNVFVLAADLRVVTRKVATEPSAVYGLPLHVPAGAQLTARCMDSTGGGTMRVGFHGFSHGLGGKPGFSRCIALYAPSSSRGIAVDPGGTAHTKTRTELIASSSARIGAIMAAIGPNADASRAAAQDWLLDIEAGASGSEKVLIPNIPISCETGLDVPTPCNTPIMPCDIPASTRFSANLQCSVNTVGDRALDVAAWGFVP